MTRPKFKTLKYNPQKWQYECNKCDYVLEHDDKRVFKLKVSFHERKHYKAEIGGGILMGPKWYVMTDYNDDNEPFMMFDDLAAVRKAFYKRRLQKINDGYYRFKTPESNNRWYSAMTLDAMIAINKKGADGVLKEFQYFGYVDEAQRKADYFSVSENWHPIVMNMTGNEGKGLLAKHLEKVLGDKANYDDGTNPLWNASAFHLKRHEKVFAKKIPKSLKEIPQ